MARSPTDGCGTALPPDARAGGLGRQGSTDATSANSCRTDAGAGRGGARLIDTTPARPVGDASAELAVTSPPSPGAHGSQRPPSSPTYEGRPLPRPEEEVVDQGLGFDLETLVSLRGLLGLFGISAASIGPAACRAGSSSPSATAGSSTVSRGAPGGTTAASSHAATAPGEALISSA
ncbi:MAG TPA: hypothetical protein VES21_13090 [Nocardioidaceae bacterium]|nr:hypothetical protein [Nocardioidaceae bacterium]